MPIWVAMDIKSGVKSQAGIFWYNCLVCYVRKVLQHVCIQNQLQQTYVVILCLPPF